HPTRRLLPAGTGGAAAGRAGGGGGRHRQNAADSRVGGLGSSAGRSRARWARLRDGRTPALPALGGRSAATAGGGKRAGGPAGGSVAGRTVTHPAGAAGALS